MYSRNTLRSLTNIVYLRQTTWLASCVAKEIVFAGRRLSVRTPRRANCLALPKPCLLISSSPALVGLPEQDLVRRCLELLLLRLVQLRSQVFGTKYVLLESNLRMMPAHRVAFTILANPFGLCSRSQLHPCLMTKRSSDTTHCIAKP